MIERYVSPAEFKRLLSSLLVVAIFIALFAIFAFVVVPGLRNANRPASTEAITSPSGEWGWLDPTEFPIEKGHVVPPIDPATVMTPNPALLSRGKTVYLQNCASCHGAKGEGDGPAGLGLATKPRNFSKAEGWKNGPRITDIYRTLDQGIKGSPMVSYNYLPRKDRMALVHVVQAFGSFEHGPEDAAALGALAKSFAASSEVIPNRIPVSAAMERLIREFHPAVPLSLDELLQPMVGDSARATLTAAQTESRGDDADLARRITAGIPGNGFAPRLITSTPETWKATRVAMDGRNLK